MKTVISIILLIILLITTPCFSEEISSANLGQEPLTIEWKQEGQAIWCAWNKKLTVIRLEDRAVWIKCEGDVVNDDYKPTKAVLIVDSVPYFDNGKIYDIHGEVKK